jgi:hypothetical protein
MNIIDATGTIKSVDNQVEKVADWRRWYVWKEYKTQQNMPVNPIDKVELCKIF